ncbi:MAG: disulfide bond formation protein B [Methylobacter sp.]|nr:MAG: disulfide bond formation protein B [Methylobacter sp.]
MINMFQFKSRVWFFLGFLATVFLLCIGAYLQLIEDQEPCPLCISQRIAILLTGLVFLAASIHNPGLKGIQAYAIAGGLAALAGGSVSARHVWLQHLPPEEVPECGPGLDYVFNNFPFSETIKLMLSGTGDCAQIGWTLLGMSIPEWTLIAFLLLAALSLLQLWNPQNSSN